MRLVLGLTLSRKLQYASLSQSCIGIDLKGLTVSLKTAEKISRQANFTISCTKKKVTVNWPKTIDRKTPLRPSSMMKGIRTSN